MSDAFTTPSDLFQPEVAKEYVGYQFPGSLGVLDRLSNFGPLGAEAPIQISGLGILQNGGRYIGQYEENPVSKPIANLGAKRDLANPGTAVDTLQLQGRNDIGVTLARRLGPISIPIADLDKYTAAGLAWAEMEFARQCARQMKEEIQQAIIMVLKAVIDHMTSTLHTLDVWNAVARTNPSVALLVRLLAKLGDRSQAINSFLMRSEVAQDMGLEADSKGVSGVTDLLQNTGKFGALGRLLAIVDDATLTTADAGFDKYHTLALGPRMINVEIKDFRFFQPQTVLDTEVANINARADYDFKIQVPGMQWDKTNGGANPALSTSGLGLSTNWDVTYSNHREILAALLTSNVSTN